MTTTQDERATQAELPGRTRQVPRSRGALSGFLLVALGAWGALIPFIGPYFNLSYRPDSAWHWTSARGWLEVLPGAVAVLGGLLSLMSASRAVISLGAWLGVGAGAWFVVGRDVANWWNIGSPGIPAGTSTAIHAVETLVMFSGLGAVILFAGASAVGRVSVTSLRDVRVAQRRANKAEKRDRRVRDEAYEEGRRDALAERTTPDERGRDEPSTVTEEPVGQHTAPNATAAPTAPPPTTASPATTTSPATTAPPAPPAADTQHTTVTTPPVQERSVPPR